jgi:hypothetical protein
VRGQWGAQGRSDAQELAPVAVAASDKNSDVTGRKRSETFDPQRNQGAWASPRIPKESPSRAFFLFVRLHSKLAVWSRTGRRVRRVGAGKWIARGPDDHWEKRDSPSRLWKQHQAAGRGGLLGTLVDTGEEHIVCQ